jgi:hypothetical protein
VDHCLPYFSQQLITHLLLTLLPFQSLFTESSCGDRLHAFPPFSSALRAPHPFCCMFLFSSLFVVQFCFCLFFFGGWGWVSLSRGLYWFISYVAVGIPRATYFCLFWTAECLPNRFGASIWHHGGPPLFSVQCCIDKFCVGWGFRVSKILFFLVFFLCQV